MNTTLTELAAHLRSRQEEIIDRWRDVCEADDVLDVVSRLTRTEFRDGIPNAIDELCRLLTHGRVEAASKEIQSDAGEHGHHRWKQGFSLAQVIRDWGKLHLVLTAVVEEFFTANPPGNPADRTEAQELLAEFMTEAMSGSINRFDELRRAEAASLAGDVQLMKDRFEALTEARSQLLREAAHDIRGGLSAVAMASQVLKLPDQPNDSFADALHALDHGVESVKDMLNSLLDLSRLESGAEEVELLSVDVAQVLEELAAEHQPKAASRGLTLSCRGPRELIVTTDPNKVWRIAQNLIANALEHTTSGEVCLSWTREQKRWLMRIADTGPGIQDVAGTPLSRELNEPGQHGSRSHPRKYGGYDGEGIGLTIVKRLCDLLGAGVSLESEMGRGSTFTVEFPLAYEHAP